MKVCGAHYDGGFAEYMVAPQDALARIPEHLDHASAGPLMCAGITTYNSMRNQHIKSGSIVAVLGVGGLGHLAIQFANKMGFEVVAVSSGKDKEKLAKELGAHHYIDSSSGNPAEQLQKLGGAKLIVCTAPHAKTVEDMIPGLAISGKMLVIGVIAEPIKVNSLQLLMKKQSITGWPSGDSRDSEETFRFAVVHSVKPMIESFPLEKAAEALKKMEDNKVRFRGVLVMKK